LYESLESSEPLISFKIFDLKSGGVAGVFGMNPKNHQNKKSLEILPIP
tara:strand:- start:15213 stop:15356 length:144 start_codon:yes stop_codon:yes gene_type:complete